jgi:hypothetical protein
MEDGVYIPPVPITLDSLKNRIQTAIAKMYQPLLQNIWHEVKYRLDMCHFDADTVFCTVDN